MATATYSAELRARKYTSTSNFKASAASQEFYDSSYNLVGIISFTGMNLANKVISSISLTMTSTKAGFGAGHTKTVFLRKAVYQNASTDVTGGQYVGDALGTFDGSFYDNTTSYTMSGTLLTNMANYIAAGNNTFTIYNPTPSASYQGWSNNYLQWTNVTITVTYTEGVSVPTTSKSAVNLGSAVTIYTNRVNTSATHTVTYAFGGASGTIGTNVGASVSWTPALALAVQIPNATAGICTIFCYTYYGGTLTGTSSCTITLNVPDTVKPTFTLGVREANTDIYSQFGCYVRTRSMLSITIEASGAQGSTISSYRTTVNGTTYTTNSFITGYLYTAGENTISATVTDSRGRSTTLSNTITVVDYNPPSLTSFSAERCNDDGTAAQTDGTKVRVSIRGSVSPVNNNNTITCTVYYKLKSASAWTSAGTIAADGYVVEITNSVLAQTYAVLSSYDIMVRLQDYFSYVEQSVNIGTKQVIMDLLNNGKGIAFGKVAENSEKVEFGWPLVLSTPLAVEYGGTGANNAALARFYLGAVSKTGDTMTGNLNIQSALYPSLYLVPTYNNTTNRTVFEGSYLGASSFAAWEDGSGNNRRMLEVRTKAFQNSLDWAVLLRVADAGVWGSYRIFHMGMETPVPVANGGTGASTAAGALSALGANNASNLTAGTISKARLPFKFAYGSTTVNSSNDAFIDYSSAGFSNTPMVFATYSTTGGNWSGDNGALKVHNKTASWAWIIVGGSFSTQRQVDWFAIGT